MCFPVSESVTWCTRKQTGVAVSTEPPWCVKVRSICFNTIITKAFPTGENSSGAL